MEDVIDSQILAEHVAFLDNCFDNSFALQSSLNTVKNYVAENNDYIKPKELGNVSSKTHNATLQNKTPVLDSSICNNSKIISQIEDNKVSKKLCDWGLPYEITKKYEQKGIIEMFDWQVTCLGNPKILLECCNLVYSAPTSAGKTLVAEILTIKTVLERQKKAIIILPFVSIVREKMYYFQDILSSSGIRVEGFMGSQSPPGGLQAVHIAICTIEKANSLINRLLDDGNISELGAVIVDELHLLGDSHRGYILELLLTKIKYVSSKFEHVHIQIIGMSATLPNLEVLATWLDAELFITQFRPIPLDEFCLVGNSLYDKHGNHVNSLNNAKSTTTTNDGDNVLAICLDTIKDGCSVLIFCMTKNRCEHLAQSIASSFYKMGCTSDEMGRILRDQLKSDRILEVLEQLKNCPVGLDQVLKNTISFGVAYHHAGLTFDERDIIEGALKSGAIRVLVATSTLSSGVNLPARKVVIRSPVFQRQPINILTYKQMIGRAGRMGKDIKGESILICTESEKKIGFDLMMGALDPIKSCIESEDKYMRAILEMIASQVASTLEDLDMYTKCTLLFNEQNISSTHNVLLENTLEELKHFELVRVQGDGDKKLYVATHLGKACLSSSMAPNDGLSLFCELQKARQCLVLETDLHLIYLVTPYSVSSQWADIDWLHLLTLWESLTKAMKRVGELVGVQESFIIRCLRGGSKMNNIQSKLNIHKRFYTALALQDLVNEVPLSEVANKFQCARGFLQSLQQAAATFAGMVTSFCRQLGWKNMEMLISQFQDRLHFGIHSELVDLMKLSLLNGIRARSLFDAGFETISSIALGDVNQIVNALHKAVPFQSEKERDNDDSADIRKRKKIKNIWITGCCGLTVEEAAENLILEARKFVENDIGLAKINWNNELSKSNSDSKTSTINKSMLENMSNEVVLMKEEVETEELINPIKKRDIELAENSIHINSNENESGIDIKDEFETSLCKNKSKEKFTRNKKQIVSNNDDQINRNKINLNNEFNNLSKQVQSCVNEAVNSSNKDEVLWDSLNVTGTVLENISKVQEPQKMSSPNINVQNSYPAENTSGVVFKSASMIDTSLFSSEGDDSSLFEDSLPLDQISSKFIEGKEQIETIMLPPKQETTADYININSNTVVNAFNSPLVEFDEDEDIKLVYEEENKIAENELESTLSISEDVEVLSTQEVNGSWNNDTFKSPLKRQGESFGNNKKQPLCKKIKIYSEKVETFASTLNKTLSLGNECSKRFTLQINNDSLECFILKGQDIFNNFHIIENILDAAVYLDVNNGSMLLNDVIGSNVVKKPKPSKAEISSHLQIINGIAIYSGEDKCVYLNFDTLNNKVIDNKISNFLQQDNLKLKMLSLKSNYIYIKKCYGIDLPLSHLDISLTEWLLDSDVSMPNIYFLCKKYCDVSSVTIRIDNDEKKLQNLSRVEDTCFRAWCLWRIAKKQGNLLEENQHILSAINTEVQVSRILAECEFNGLTVDKELASQLLIDVRNSQDILQKKAYKICGYHFNFNSSKDVAKVLGIYKGRKVSTKKSVLTSHNSPMASIVIYWRKLNSILTKTLYPLTERACIYSSSDRINPTYTMYTCTGRISMHEPNLQNVPRTFSIPLNYLSNDSEPNGDVIEFNCRNIFKAAPGFVLVSADYCQLEMRILTHYCGDEVLTKIMSSNVDVFKCIGASWSNLPEEEVDDDLRQKAKQLCYGIIYGMGNKTLAVQLDVSETEAAVFMDSFYKTYPAIRVFTQKVVDDCKRTGFVETLMKRRRRLPYINSTVVSKKSAAERQAVNTLIQGSAADIAKAAMCAIDNRTNKLPIKPRLILQMHDELIYEVHEHDKKKFIAIMKNVMEETVRLKVPLPVKVRSGYTWGSLEELQL